MLEESVVNHRADVRPDARTLVVMVIDLTQGRYRGAVKITQWLHGVVSSRIRHCPHVRSDAASAELDANALARVLEAA